jgi:radical SAM protein with 4Fe4S-binding SPASM domain
MGVEWINLGGGEPYLRRDLLEIIDFASRLGLKTGLPTKHEFTAEQMKSLKDAGLKTIGISLDSHIPSLANKLVRDSNFFQGSIQNIKLAKKADLGVLLMPVITRKTIRNFPDFLEFAERLGVDIVRPQLYITPFSKSPVRDLQLADPAKAWKWINSIKSPILEKSGLQGKEQGSNSIHSEVNYPTNCALGRGILQIKPNGKVYFCPLIPNYIVGNIRENTLKDIWSKGKIRDLLFPKRKFFRGTKCYKCEYFDFCAQAGRCSENCISNFGRAFAPDSFLCSHYGK